MLDIKYMERALELAKMGSGKTNPNPLVGAVIVKDGRIIGEGYHQVYGSHHAEINAFINATEDVKGATMYVTLEPCSHFGKTPPCADAIVKNKIKKVFIGLKDPNPLVAGRGIKILEAHGIEVVTGILSEEGKKLNEIFLKYITTKVPFCFLETATNTGDSKEYLHQLRHRVAGIMIGIETIISENPLLTTRLKDGRDATRIIVDCNGIIPLDAKILNLTLESKTIIATTKKADKTKIKALEVKGVEVILAPLKNGRVDLTFLMKELGARKIDSVLLEGGGEINNFALLEGIVDKVIDDKASKLLDGYIEGRMKK